MQGLIEDEYNSFLDYYTGEGDEDASLKTITVVLSRIIEELTSNRHDRIYNVMNRYISQAEIAVTKTDAMIFGLKRLDKFNPEVKMRSGDFVNPYSYFSTILKCFIFGKASKAKQASLEKRGMRCELGESVEIHEYDSYSGEETETIYTRHLDGAETTIIRTKNKRCSTT